METFFDYILGPNSMEIQWWQMLIRAVSVFFVALLILRLGGTRIFGANTSFDIVMGIILGSILSRAITANSPFFPTLIAAITLVFLHRTLAFVAFKNSHFGPLIKGKKTLLVIDGEMQWKNMEKKQITQNDIMEALRLKGNIDLPKVRYAYLERSGEISIII